MPSSRGARPGEYERVAIKSNPKSRCVRMCELSRYDLARHFVRSFTDAVELNEVPTLIGCLIYRQSGMQFFPTNPAACRFETARLIVVCLAHAPMQLLPERLQLETFELIDAANLNCSLL